MFVFIDGGGLHYEVFAKVIERIKFVRACAIDVVGEHRVVGPVSTMGGEDMAFYLEQVPGCFFFVGIGREGAEPLHTPSFDFDEIALDTGVEMLCRIALGRLIPPEC